MQSSTRDRFASALMALRAHLRRGDHHAAIRLALERARALRTLLELEQPGRYNRSVIDVQEEETETTLSARRLRPPPQSGEDDVETETKAT